MPRSVIPRRGAAPVVPMALVALGLAGCDATGSIEGGASLQPNPCAADAGQDWSDLQACYFGRSGPGPHDMPYNGSYTFTAADLARISDWMRQGAPED